MASQTPFRPLGRRPPWEVRFEKPIARDGAKAEDQSEADENESHDGDHLDDGKPVFEFAKVADTQALTAIRPTETPTTQTHCGTVGNQTEK